MAELTAEDRLALIDWFGEMVREADEPVIAAIVDRHVAAALESVAVAWDQGYRSGFSNAMRRMSDEPDAPTSPNPYIPTPAAARSD